MSLGGSARFGARLKGSVAAQVRRGGAAEGGDAAWHEFVAEMRVVFMFFSMTLVGFWPFFHCFSRFSWCLPPKFKPKWPDVKR